MPSLTTDFYRFAIEGYCFTAGLCEEGPYIEAEVERSILGSVPLGPSSIRCIESTDPPDEAEAQWWIVKWGGQHRICVEHLSAAGRFELSKRFGIPIDDPVPMGGSERIALFIGSDAFQRLCEWSLEHPRLFRNYSDCQRYIPWADLVHRATEEQYYGKPEDTPLVEQEINLMPLDDKYAKIRDPRLAVDGDLDEDERARYPLWLSLYFKRDLLNPLVIAIEALRFELVRRDLELLRDGGYLGADSEFYYQARWGIGPALSARTAGMVILACLEESTMSQVFSFLIREPIALFGTLLVPGEADYWRDRFADYGTAVEIVTLDHLAPSVGMEEDSRDSPREADPPFFLW